VAVWLVFFPAIVPIRLRTTLIVVLLIAVMPPVSRALLQGLGWVELPEESLANLTLLMVFSSVMGIGVSHVVYKLGKSVTAAREMGSYTLEESLGDGGMGEVWRASHRMLARPAAVKLIKPEVLRGMDAGEIERLNLRFEQEVQATAALQSPHTVNIYDYGLAQDGTFYYVMELLDGIDMETLIERFGPIEPPRAVYLMIQACHSLHEAHNRQLIHRDIKPANLFVCRYGEDLDFVKVLDFGLVKHEKARDEGEMKLTAEGTITGTPSYMCPESVTGKSPVDHRSDIYALGCVMYWLLTGSLVFPAETPMAMLMEHVNAEPVPPSKRSEMLIPEDLDRVVLDCLAKDPAGRPQSADELAVLLREIDFEGPWDQEHARSWWHLHHGD
jgi:serine/threonine-protein kinase